MSAVLTSVNRKDDNFGDDLVEHNKFDVSKQCKDCVDLQNVGFVGQAIIDHL